MDPEMLRALFQIADSTDTDIVDLLLPISMTRGDSLGARMIDPRQRSDVSAQEAAVPQTGEDRFRGDLFRLLLQGGVDQGRSGETFDERRRDVFPEVRNEVARMMLLRGEVGEDTGNEIFINRDGMVEFRRMGQEQAASEGGQAQATEILLEALTGRQEERRSQGGGLLDTVLRRIFGGDTPERPVRR